MGLKKPKVRVVLEPSVTEREGKFYPAYRARVELRNYPPQEERYVYVVAGYDTLARALFLARYFLPDAMQYVQRLWELELENGSLRAANYGQKTSRVENPSNALKTPQEPF